MSKNGRGKDGGDEPERSPWLVGVRGVRGVIPPGRRLSPATERRPNAWSASGVKGVTPPGHQKPGEGPADETRAQAERRAALRDKAAKSALAEAKRKKAGAQATASPRKSKQAARVDPGRPAVGFTPHPFDDQRDPKDLKTYLDHIAAFFTEHRPGPDAAESVAELIVQSRAPYAIAVGFTILSVLVGRDSGLRRRYMLQLERGAKTFFNLSMRLDKSVKPPRGLAPHTVDPIFYDLPSVAYQAPFAFATDALWHMLDLLRGDPKHDAALLELARGLREQHIERRSLGDKALRELFPLEEPGWAPEPDEPDEGDAPEDTSD